MSDANPQLRPKAALITDPNGVTTANVTEINPGEGALDVNVVAGGSGGGPVTITGPGGVNTAIVTDTGALDVALTAPLVQNVVQTTGVLVNGSSATLDVPMPLAGPLQLLWVTVSAFSRIEAYDTSAHRAADAARPYATPPGPSVAGIISDAVLLSTLSLRYTDTFGENGDSPLGDTLYFTVTNLSGGPAAITFNISYTNSLVP